MKKLELSKELPLGTNGNSFSI